MVVVEPFVAQATAGVLSEAMAKFMCGRVSVLAAMMLPVIRAASSKSLFVTVPVLCCAEMSAWRIAVGKGARQR